MLLNLRARYVVFAQRLSAAFSRAEHVKFVKFSPEKPKWASDWEWDKTSLRVRREIARGDFSISYEEAPPADSTYAAHDDGEYLPPRQPVAASEVDYQKAFAHLGTWGPDGLTIPKPPPPNPGMTSNRKTGRHWWSRRK